MSKVRMGMALASALMALACGGDAVDEEVDRLLSLQSDWGDISQRYAMAICDCWDDPGGAPYASERVCLDDIAPPADEADYIVGPDCVREAYSLDIEAATAYVECEDVALDELSDCLREAAVCDAVYACIEDYAMSGCPGLPDCISVTFYVCADWPAGRPEGVPEQAPACR